MSECTILSAFRSQSLTYAAASSSSLFGWLSVYFLSCLIFGFGFGFGFLVNVESMGGSEWMKGWIILCERDERRKKEEFMHDLDTLKDSP